MGELLIKETQLKRIIRKTGRKPCECKCSLCKMQCHTPCIGTPQDIENLIDAGYTDKLAPTLWGAGMIMGVIDENIPFPISTWERTYRYKGYGYNMCRETKKKLLEAIQKTNLDSADLSMYNNGGWD